jgi:hypothetical protein
MFGSVSYEKHFHTRELTAQARSRIQEITLPLEGMVPGKISNHEAALKPEALAQTQHLDGGRQLVPERIEIKAVWNKPHLLRIHALAADQ